MLPRTLWIFNFVSAAFLLSACASWTTPPKSDVSAPPLEKVFDEPYEVVWRASQLVMSKYPMKLSDIDSGIYETLPVRGEKAWITPGSDKTPSGGQRYKISLKLIKGQDADGFDATKVTILKRAEIQRDFFSEYEKLPSDGLEEKSIMYRIEREIQIEKALKRVKRE